MEIVDSSKRLKQLWRERLDLCKERHKTGKSNRNKLSQNWILIQLYSTI